MRLIQLFTTALAITLASTSAAHAKVEIYAGAKIEQLWLVDARARTVDAYVLDQHGWWSRNAHLVDGQEIAAPPFVASPIPPEDVWPPYE